MNVLIVQGLLLTFFLVVILMPLYIKLLKRLRFGKRISVDGPHSHMIKEGTPTTGGLLIIGVVLAVALALNLVDAATFAPLATLVLVGALGAADDYLNVRTGRGIRVREKLVWLTVLSVYIAFEIQQTYAITAITVPFLGPVSVAPIIFVVFAAGAITGASNGVNLTDGLDGLAGGTLIFAFVAYMIIAMLNVPNQTNLAILCALLIGGLLGFLWFNVHPAQIIMGDAGSLSFGATLAVTALITGQILSDGRLIDTPWPAALGRVTPTMSR
ncbi:MAG: phospho-N-acetylmuramoyl-pentapeptide-transferase [Chloroflexi bacterium]|nr:phospho-N-acetylmuramoyl-pentapeptide-transferase [Chloroflexota bacterium]